MTELPDPLTPADCDLRDFAFMPVDIARLLGSEFHAHASDAGWRAGVTLWLRAWHQVPAGSLPNDDVALCRLAELGRDLRTFRKTKADALRGWEIASDGRLYHATVAEKVNEAWDRKLRQRHRTFCATIRKHNERHKPEEVTAPSFEDWLELGRPDKVSGLICRVNDATPVTHNDPATSRTTNANVACDIGSKGQGQGQGQGDYNTEPNGSSRGWPCPANVDPDHWRDFLKNRKTRRLTNSETAYRGQLRELDRIASDGWPPGRLVQHAAEKGWGSINDPTEQRYGKSDPSIGKSQAAFASLGYGDEPF